MDFTDDIKQPHKVVKFEKTLFYQLMSPRLCEELTWRILQVWKEQFIVESKSFAFPGPQPASIEKSDFKYLKTRKYVVCAKYDGERFFLYLTRVNGICLSLMVNRNFQWFIVDQNFNIECYDKNTLFDGEFMSSQTQSSFIIHDTFVACGTNLLKNDFQTRFTIGNELLKTKYHRYSTKPKNTFDIRYKTFYLFSHIKSIFDEIKQTTSSSSTSPPLNIDGIVFYPMNAAVGMGTQLDLYKWKSLHTIDFIVKVAPFDEPNLELYEGYRGKEKLYKTISIESFVKSNIELPQNNQNNCVVEFKVENGQFIPLKIRKDKPKGNSRYTVRKTLFNIQENIQESDLCQLAALVNTTNTKKNDNDNDNDEELLSKQLKSITFT